MRPTPNNEVTARQSDENAPEASADTEVPWFVKSLLKAYIGYSPTYRTAAKRCAALGAIGIFFGFAVFVLLWEEQDHPYVFLVALVVGAGGWAFLFEWLRTAIEGRRGEEQEPWSLPRFITGVSIATTFELFIIAGHYLIEHLRELPEIGNVVLGPLFDGDMGAQFRLLAFVAIWLIVGSAISAALTGVVRLECPADASRWRQFGWPSAAGAMVALLAPIGVILGVIVSRIIRAVLIWWAPLLAMIAIAGIGAWCIWSSNRDQVSALDTAPMRQLRNAKPLAGCALVGAMIVALIGYFLEKVIEPINENSVPLLRSLLVAFAVWLWPCVMFGVLVPVIKRSSDKLQDWGILAFFAAAMLTAITLMRTKDQWTWFLILAIVALAGIGVLFRRGWSVHEYWPLAAVTIAVIATSVNVFVQTTRDAFMAYEATYAIPMEPSRDPYRFLSKDDRAIVNSFIIDFERHMFRTPDPDPSNEAELLADIRWDTQSWIREGLSMDEMDRNFLRRLPELDKLTADAAKESLRERCNSEKSLYWGLTDYKAEVQAEQETMDSPENRPHGLDYYKGLKLHRHFSDPEIWNRVQLELSDLGREEHVRSGKIESLKSTFLAAKPHFARIQRSLQETQNSIARMLELCITGAFGFWVTGGLLLASRALHDDHSS